MCTITEGIVVTGDGGPWSAEHRGAGNLTVGTADMVVVTTLGSVDVTTGGGTALVIPVTPRVAVLSGINYTVPAERA
jgi:hypothetical protein